MSLALPSGITPAPGIRYTIISGLPGGGKTTLANLLASNSDLVLDLDDIVDEIVADEGDSVGTLARALEVRNSILRGLLSNEYENVFLIVCAPTRAMCSHWQTMLKAGSIRVVPSIRDIEGRDISALRKRLAREWFQAADF